MCCRDVSKMDHYPVLPAAKHRSETATFRPGPFAVSWTQEVALGCIKAEGSKNKNSQKIPSRQKVFFYTEERIWGVDHDHVDLSDLLLDLVRHVYLLFCFWKACSTHLSGNKIYLKIQLHCLRGFGSILC